MPESCLVLFDAWSFWSEYSVGYCFVSSPVVCRYWTVNHMFLSVFCQNIILVVSNSGIYFVLVQVICIVVPISFKARHSLWKSLSVFMFPFSVFIIYKSVMGFQEINIDKKPSKIYVILCRLTIWDTDDWQVMLIIWLIISFAWERRFQLKIDH